MLGGIIFLAFTILFYFRLPLLNFFSRISLSIAVPFWKISTNIKENFSNYSYLFTVKKTLISENDNLKKQVLEMQSKAILNNILLDENTKLKDILGRKNIKKQMILATILSKPNSSPYGTLVIDIGEKDGILLGQNVFARANILIGNISEVYENFAVVKLFSGSGEKTEVVLSGSDIYLLAIGRGGGGFEILAPRDLLIEKDAEILMPSVDLNIIAVVKEIVSDQRDSFQKVLLSSPVNIQELKWVEVEK